MKSKYINLICILIIFVMSGCTAKSKNFVEKKEIILSDEKVIERKDFEIEYSSERIIFFRPIIMEDGAIISSREITLLPKAPTWVNKKLSISKSKSLSNYLNKKRISKKERSNENR